MGAREVRCRDTATRDGGDGLRRGRRTLRRVRRPGAPAHAAEAASPSPSPSPIGVTTRTYVDESRPTAANGDCPELPSRTLMTAVYYPAAGGPPGAAQPDAAPASSGGPYPLIVFTHGFSATPDIYRELLQHWASAGYVVAAPTFPLSSGTSPCGAVAGDVSNQPKDMSFVITSVLDDSRQGHAAVGARGCRAHRGGGSLERRHHDLWARRQHRSCATGASTPPPSSPAPRRSTPRGSTTSRTCRRSCSSTGPKTLVPYSAAQSGFNAARGPKGLLSVTNGDHGSAASAVVEPATTDFFGAYLRGDTAARDRLPLDQTAGVSTMKFVAEEGSTATVPTVKPIERHLKATVTPHKNLHGGQMVTVAWSGYTPGKVVNVLQCNGGDRDLSKSNECDYAKAALLHPDPTGEGSLQLEMVEGPVGTSACDATHPGCFIIVNDASSTDPKDSVQVDISFAP